MKNIILLLLLIKPTNLQKYFPYNLIIWNVGQGQWITYYHKNTCFHFDMGGEIYPKKAEELCRSKPNKIFISHLDWDHINFIRKFSQRTESLCLIFPRKLPKSLRGFKVCENNFQNIVQVYGGYLHGSKNDSSIVYRAKNKVLIPGDSPMKFEKVYSQDLKQIDILILGHHGSHTSTSMKLLKKIKPKIAISSARRNRYGHPHKKVIRKLSKYRIVLLETEKQGHIYLALKELL